jgi:large conductance mechanosensitive channel
MATDAEMLEELKKIRELLTPAPKPKPTPPKGFREEFKVFLTKYNVMGLAVAFILGLYLKDLVNALVDDLVMPVVEPFLPETETWELITVGPFRVGHFTGELLTFIIVAFVIFVLVKITSRIGID